MHYREKVSCWYNRWTGYEGGERHQDSGSSNNQNFPPPVWFLFLSYVNFFCIYNVCPDSRETLGKAERGIKEGEGQAFKDWEGNKGFL